MFKNLSIKNFRTHKDSKLNFHPGVNVIVGLSRSGKTNIFRALRWLFFYRPVGDSIVSDFAKKETSGVKLETDTNNVSLSKLNNKSTYELDGNKLSGFGTTVPEEITKALNISEINIQEQIEEHFLITKSSGEVARTINEIVRIEKADSYISNLTTKINSTNQKIGILEEQNRKTKEEIDSLNYLNDLKIKVDKWTDLDDKIKGIDTECLFLGETKEKIDLIDKENNIFIDVIKTTEKEIKELEDSLIKISSIEKEISLIEQYKNFKEKYSKKDIILIEGLLKDLEESIDQTYDLDTSIDTLIDYQNSFEGIKKEVDGLENEESDITFNIEILIQHYIEILEREKQCPTCYGPIDSKCIQEMEKKLNEIYL